MSNESTSQEIVEEYIRRVEKSIEVSGSCTTKLTAKKVISPEVLEVETMHNPPYLCLVNHLCSYPGVVHLHVGFFKGGSLFAALDGNPDAVVYANDSFFNQGLESPLGQEFQTHSTRLGFDGRYKLFDCPFEEVPLSAFNHKVNFLAYDAHHSEEAQYNGVYRWSPVLDDVFILLVDDWFHFETNPIDMDAPKRGTLRAIQDRGYEICQQWELRRHVGQGIFVLRKRNV